MYDRRIAKDMANDSSQISPEEADLMAAVLQNPWPGGNTDETLLKHFTTPDDLLLKEPCSVAIFQVPSTYWKIVTVTPVSHAMSAATVIYHAILAALIICVSAAVIGAFLTLNSMLMRPLSRITHQLKNAVDINAEEMLCLDDDFRNEFGTFAYWFNVRTRKLADALGTAAYHSRRTGTTG